MCTDCVSFAGYDDIETSPYEDIELELVRNSEVTKLASIVAGTSDLQHSSNVTYTNRVSALCRATITDRKPGYCYVSALLYLKPMHH